MRLSNAPILYQRVIRSNNVRGLRSEPTRAPPWFCSFNAHLHPRSFLGFLAYLSPNLRLSLLGELPTYTRASISKSETSQQLEEGALGGSGEGLGVYETPM
ncbi:uncharacterized protein YALI1_F02993g [Yarrowia lipolytica]|uniref:Uncharacterized protein n=1 Tax=Yarrowia lipolytica TaxID=4952 RepID=A0A1D8NLK2_YARLL|nr:hypothetical protein YALI1_F02993g [Yarrowia lipolytica]